MLKIRRIVSLFLIVMSMAQCRSTLILTFSPDMSNDPLNSDNKVHLSSPIDRFSKLGVTTKTDGFFVKNYKNDSVTINKLYNFSKQKWKVYTANYEQYEVEFYKESNLINSQRIHNIKGFDGIDILESIYKAEIIRYRFKKDSVTVNNFANGKLVLISKRKI